MRLDVVDLSHHNGDCDFVKAKTAGLLGVIHKATEGSSFVDEDYWQRKEAAQAAGLCWASYHFLKHGNIESQMIHYVNFIEPERGERVVIDFEDEDCTLEDLHRAVEQLQLIDMDLQITIYSGHLIKDLLQASHDELLATTSLWIAQYNSTAASWPKGTWKAYSLWQYSDGEAGGDPKEMEGIARPHDCNEFNGSPENCVKWFGPPEEEIPDEGDEDDGFVDIDISAPEGIEVRVSVNGKPRV